MKNRFTKSSELRFYAKVKKLDGTIKIKVSPRKAKIALFLNRHSDKFKYIYLRVTYKKGITNEGKYFNYPEVKNAWLAFTDEDLIKEALNY
jgi:hypothetical protein